MEKSDQTRLELLKNQHNDTVEFIEVRYLQEFQGRILANDCLQKLLRENKDLATRLDEKTLDYDSMKTSCRVTQRELNLMQSVHQESERRMVSTQPPPTTLVGIVRAGRSWRSPSDQSSSPNFAPTGVDQARTGPQAIEIYHRRTLPGHQIQGFEPDIRPDRWVGGE